MRPGEAEGVQRSTGASVILLGVLAVLGLAVVAPASAGPTDPAVDEALFTRRVNEERSARGIAALRTTDDLVTIARQHSQRMASERRLYHNPNLGNEMQNWRVAGENVGTGGEVEPVHQAFMESTTHRDDILRPGFTEMGVGVAWSDGVLWVTEVFREPMTTSAPAPQPAPPPEPAPAPEPPPRTSQSVRPAPAATAAPSPSTAPTPAAPAAPAARAAATPVAAQPAPLSTSAPTAPGPTASPSPAPPAPDTVPASGPASDVAAAPLPVPAGVPSIPPAAALAAGLLAAAVGFQGFVVRRLIEL